MKAKTQINAGQEFTLRKNYAPYSAISFNKINQQAKDFADIIESRFEKLTDILLQYESYEVVKDETDRTIDLLRNLNENKSFFKLRIRAVTSFLPRNQPLYALTCFVIIPSLMASDVHFRIPHSTRHFFSDMIDLLDVQKLFPNIIISNKQRIEFLKEQSALVVNPKNNEDIPATDVVIFTGISAHADQLRMVFDKRVLFIANGAGHNPVIISKDADLYKAVEAVSTLQFYNQGQDCAAPNAILVQKNVLQNFLNIMRENIRNTKVGSDKDKSWKIGPISDPQDLVRIQNFLVENREWLDASTPGIIRSNSSIVEPTLICKPLSKGGNFSEIFAPIIFVQEYENDSDLKEYFENKRYARHAMYVTLYGTSNYIKNLVGKSTGGQVLHNKSSIIHNTHLHSLGVERGTKPYGGSGYGASSISINGKIMSMPTLPQRDIYNWVVKPLLKKKKLKTLNNLKDFTKIEVKNVVKLLRLQSREITEQEQIIGNNVGYLDLHSIKNTNGSRYWKIEENNHYCILEKPNLKHISSLRPSDLKSIHSLKKLILRKSSLPVAEFRNLLYNIPKLSNATPTQNKEEQNRFFKNVYQLLLGKEYGPPLAQFILDIETEKAYKLLNVV
ncbi:MAG: aldehyde dehydrogenase family protein [bacterium]|nr:aldehyde dehydrogenase family protein [bacterium]